MGKKIRNIILATLFVPLVLLLFLVIIWLTALINPEKDPIPVGGNVIHVGYFITLLGVPIAYLFSKGKSKKARLKIWGLAILLLSGVFIYSFGFSLALYGGDGFIALGLWLYYFPVLFLIDLIVMLIGVFKKDKTK